MKYDYVLAQDAGGLWLKGGGRRARRVCTVAQACRLLRRTRRQVYRQLAAGLLQDGGKVLGEWLLDLKSVERLAQSPLFVQPLPARLKPLFPEYDVAGLNAGRDRVLVISRVLEGGGRADLRWLLSRYPEPEIVRFLEEDGPRLLTRRSLKLWCLRFGARPKAPPAWRSDPWRAAQP